MKTSGRSDVALVITVFNESGNISSLLEAIRQQTLLPRELIFVDGGSTDTTFRQLQKASRIWPRIKVFQVPGNRSVGRNFGVAHSSAPLIAFTDAGCLPDPDWLEQLTRPFSDTKTQVVSGYYRGQYHNIFQKSLLPYVLVMPDQAVKTEFYPSTRSMALRRTVWNRSGGFDTRLDPSEDFAYAHWLKRQGVNFTFTPAAQVVWFPRRNLGECFWMFLRFANGDIHAGIFRPRVKRLLIRFLIFLFLISLAIQIHSLIYLICLIFLIYLTWSIFKNYKYVRHVQAFFWLPVIQLTADVAVLLGTIIGFLSKR